MQFSCLPVSLYTAISAGERTLADWFRLAAALGLDGADISVAHLASLDSAYLGGLRNQAQDAGVVIAGMVTYTDFTHPDPAVRQRHRQELRDYIDAAALMSVDFLRVTAGQKHPGVKRADGACLGRRRFDRVGGGSEGRRRDSRLRESCHWLWLDLF